MILKSEHFNGQLKKIAQSITELEVGSKSNLNNSSGSSSSLGLKDPKYDNYYKPRRRDFKVRTFSQYRDKADLQPLHKDSQNIKNPPDMLTVKKMDNKQDYLGNIKDNRMLFDHLRNQ